MSLSDVATAACECCRARGCASLGVLCCLEGQLIMILIKRGYEAKPHLISPHPNPHRSLTIYNALNNVAQNSWPDKEPDTSNEFHVFYLLVLESIFTHSFLSVKHVISIGQKYAFPLQPTSKYTHLHTHTHYKQKTQSSQHPLKVSSRMPHQHSYSTALYCADNTVEL